MIEIALDEDFHLNERASNGFLLNGLNGSIGLGPEEKLAHAICCGLGLKLIADGSLTLGHTDSRKVEGDLSAFSPFEKFECCRLFVVGGREAFYKPVGFDKYVLQASPL
jgi:hypothetical protein